ncbi:hypothetical protein NDU88_000832 [Pleurodeles waltl]|uniref:Uncharacterized protein n=1 Tax=Pleurodeles waltl TaxID=8319 RepID=A0AAV7Q573_PLEWA|nr:hypothetical protein NDU88_000832 [Pleurodeles waltl]
MSTNPRWVPGPGLLRVRDMGISDPSREGSGWAPTSHAGTLSRHEPIRATRSGSAGTGTLARMRGVPHAAASATSRGASAEGPEDRAPTRSYLSPMCGALRRRMRLRVMAAAPSPHFRFLPLYSPDRWYLTRSHTGHSLSASGRSFVGMAGDKLNRLPCFLRGISHEPDFGKAFKSFSLK